MLTIIGCGNLNRSDDGVGVVVAQRLQDRLRRHPVPGVQVFDCGTAGVEVMFKARGSQMLVVLDACVSGAEPGTLFEVPGHELAEDHEPGYSLHDFRWDHAIAAGKKMFSEDFPERVAVYLVEAEKTTYGLELSTPVEKAAEQLYGKILHRLAEYAAQRRDSEQQLAQQTVQVEVKRGSIRLSKDVYERYFHSKEGVLLMERAGRLCLVPVDPMAGGLLVKQRNLAGDRVIHAAEFLQEHGFQEDHGQVPLQWEPELGGLALVQDGLGTEGKVH